MVAHERVTDQWVRVWRGGFSGPPFPLDDQTLLVAFSAASEWSCFIQLGWPMPARCIDLYVEFIRILNGSREGKLFPSLLSSTASFGIDTMAADHKGAMRDLVMTGGPWTPAEQAEILHYCAEDVRVTGDLFQAMLSRITENELSLGGTLLRGRYTQAVARMEATGIPIDLDTYPRLSNGWESIKLDLIEDIDRKYQVYEGTTFVARRFAAWLYRQKFPWPRLPSGQLALDDKSFSNRAKIYPEVASLRELRHSLGKLRLNSLTIGKDARNRTSLMPFGSKTGRNQPSNSRFIFGASKWMRSLIKPEPGRSIAYVDWSSQEVAIAGALSGDDVLWDAYSSGDPYMGFARQVGLVPPGATKATHQTERQRAKAVVLGVGYGMGAESIADTAGLHIEEARKLLRRHKETYRTPRGTAANNLWLDVESGSRHHSKPPVVAELAHASQRGGNDASRQLPSHGTGYPGLLPGPRRLPGRGSHWRHGQCHHQNARVYGTGWGTGAWWRETCPDRRGTDRLSKPLH
jgi:hypothetical protein